VARLKALREQIPCGYCFQEWATGYDHLVPYSKGGLTVDSNLYPACRRCNGLLAAKMFNSIEEKREYVRNRLIEKGVWKVPSLQEQIREEEISSTVRQAEVSKAVLGLDPPKDKPSGRRAQGKVRGNKERVRPKQAKRVVVAELKVCLWCGAFDCQSMKHNYRKIVVESNLDADDGRSFAICHEATCEIYNKGYCNCEPKIEIEYLLGA